MITDPDNTLVTITNAHGPACGPAPQLIFEPDEHRYLGYFTSSAGDQWLLRIDVECQEGTLWGGDLGWEHPIAITDNSVRVILREDERRWLSACWRAALGHELVFIDNLVAEYLMSRNSGRIKNRSTSGGALSKPDTAQPFAR